MKKGIKFFLVSLIAGVFFWQGIIFFQDKLEKFFYAQISQPLENIVFVKIPKRPKKPKPILQSESAFSLKINKAGREKIIFSKDIEKILPIASLTKLMTALVFFENTPSDILSSPTTISKKAAQQENIPVYGNLKAGESFQVKKLLELMLFYSSNDAAFALSEIVGPESFFVEKMNQKAKTLGLEDTHFINPTGLDPEDEDTDLMPNYSTIKNLVKLSQYILENHPLIFEISSQQGPYPRKNGISDLSFSDNQKLVGAKTGYTEMAGGCMLMILEDEKENIFFNIILGTDSPETRVQEMQKLINLLNS